jgi:hypothetical protein
MRFSTSNWLDASSVQPFFKNQKLALIRGKLKEVELWDLFTTTEQREFLRKYCENSLKADSISYFNGKDHLRPKLEYEDIRTFVIDDKFLIIFFPSPIQ